MTATDGHRIIRPALVGAAIVLALVGVGTAVHAQSPSPDPDAQRLRDAGWEIDETDRYGYNVGYPPGWTMRSAERDWTFEADAADPASPAMEDFIAPDGSVRVSVWSVPLDPEKVPEDWGWVPPQDLVPWVESYCEATGNAPCTGILERAVPLCLERRDCHPGLLVPFDDDVQAFFSAGIYPQDEMIVMSVWRGASDPAAAPYGGSQALLEDFLSTMAVWPESVPLEERVVREVPRSS